MRRRLLRGLDVKFVLALVALLVSATICWGFVQRGQHITEAEQSVTQLSGQVGSLIEENRRLHRQLGRSERVAAHRAREAAREREALRLELLGLINFLRSHGLDVPARGSVYAGPSYPPPTAPVSSPQQSGGGSHASGGGSTGGSSGSGGASPSSGPGNSGSHSHGHAHHHAHHPQGHHGHGHQLNSVPSVPPLPDVPLP